MTIINKIKQFNQDRVLVVEDNETNQMLIEMLLQSIGLNCDIAINGLEAVKAVQNKEYDIILMDENMPIMSGTEATKKIRELGYSDLPIVAVTANALKGDRESFLESGMSDYLSKPINMDKLTKILDKYLNIEN